MTGVQTCALPICNWLLENQSGCVHFLAKRRIEAGSQLEEVGKDLRSKMSWGTKVEEL